MLNNLKGFYQLLVLLKVLDFKNFRLYKIYPYVVPKGNKIMDAFIKQNTCLFLTNEQLSLRLDLLLDNQEYDENTGRN